MPRDTEPSKCPFGFSPVAALFKAHQTIDQRWKAEPGEHLNGDSNGQMFGLKIDAFSSAALRGIAGAGVLDQNSPHRLSGCLQVVGLRREGSVAAQLKERLSVAFSPDGRHIASAGADQSSRSGTPTTTRRFSHSRDTSVG
jgi:hypothetical protein